jgi:hypothetical protein
VNNSYDSHWTSSVGGTFTHWNDSYPRCTRSGRAGFSHPALALGDDAQAAQGIRMMETRQRQPVGHETPQAIQGDATGLATTRQRTVPKPAHMKPESHQRGEVHGHTMVAKVP